MALMARLAGVCLCVCFAVLRGNNALRLSDADFYQYFNPEGSSDNARFNLSRGEEHREHGSRIRRYLAGEEETFGVGRRALTSEENSQDPGGKGGGGGGAPVANLNASSPTSNVTTAVDVTKLSPVPSDPDEPKTGGNYMSFHDAMRNTSTKNIADLNRTTQPKTPGVNTSTESSTSVATGVENGTSVAASNATGPINTTPVPAQSTINDNISLNTDDITFANLPNTTDMNITTCKEDHHVYYNSTFKSSDEELGKFYWVDMQHNVNAVTNDMLSQSHRRAATVKLSFDFPFYGHIVRNVTVATGGFLYTGDYVHSWLAATQYIAPLMANFDTSLSNDSFVRYVDNGTQFTVQWINVKLQDKPDSGVFTFQVTLCDNGDIIFVYKSVPLVITNIKDDHHPVKVGLSDAYIIDRTILFVRRKTIYEYHRVNFEHLPIANWTVINLMALPTCLDATDCQSCLAPTSGFECTWCPETKRCSSGIDRHRQEWLVHECDRQSITNTSLCSMVPETTKKPLPDIPKRPASEQPTTATTERATTDHEIHQKRVDQVETVTALHAKDSRSVSVSGLIGILFLIGSLTSLTLWILYAYRNPHTASGQLLIKYRPSQWSWRRGEARYTAATIHM